MQDKRKSSSSNLHAMYASKYQWEKQLVPCVKQNATLLFCNISDDVNNKFMFGADSTLKNASAEEISKGTNGQQRCDGLISILRNCAQTGNYICTFTHFLMSVVTGNQANTPVSLLSHCFAKTSAACGWRAIIRTKWRPEPEWDIGHERSWYIHGVCGMYKNACACDVRA